MCVTVVYEDSINQPGSLLYISYIFQPFMTFIRERNYYYILFSTKIFSVITFLVGIIYLRKSMAFNKIINKNYFINKYIHHNFNKPFNSIASNMDPWILKNITDTKFSKNIYIYSGKTQPFNKTHLS